MRPHGTQQRGGPGLAVLDRPFHRRGRPRPCRDAGGDIDQHGGGGLTPYRQVGARVAGIDEATGAEPADQSLGLGAAFQVVRGGRGDDLIEQVEMGGDPVGHHLIGGGGQHDAAAFGALAADVIEHRLVVRQQFRVERRGRGDAGFQVGRSTGAAGDDGAEPQAARQGDQALQQGVGANQRAVQIDAERRQIGARRRLGDPARRRRGQCRVAGVRDHVAPIDIMPSGGCKASQARCVMNVI